MERNIKDYAKNHLTVCEDDVSDTLFDIIIKFCLNHPDVLFDYDSVSSNYELRDGVYLHQEVCHRIIELTLRKRCSLLNIKQVINLFKDSTRTRLTRVDLSYTDITDKEVEILSCHPICDLKLYKCPKITLHSLRYIDRLKSTLVSLDVGNTKLWYSKCKEYKGSYKSFQISAPKLVHLGFENIIVLSRNQMSEFGVVLQSMPYLTHLDLSRSRELGHLLCFKNNHQLVSLVLFNVERVHLCIPVICSLKSLRHLDVSSVHYSYISTSYRYTHRYFENPDLVLNSLIRCLENLEYLDISGTNLDCVAESADTLQYAWGLEKTSAKYKSTEVEACSILGLSNRVGRPLEYLGLYDTAHNACFQGHIPAKRIGGQASEDQLLTACQAHITRFEMVKDILDDLTRWFKRVACFNTPLALDIIMRALKIHNVDSSVQVHGIEALIQVLGRKGIGHFDFRMKRRITEIVLEFMFVHGKNKLIHETAILCILHFKIQKDRFFDYEHFLKLLLSFLFAPHQASTVQRTAVTLLYRVSGQISKCQELLISSAGAIIILLQIFKSEVDPQIIEKVCTMIFNLTDEIPLLCEKFLDEDGMSLFLHCVEEVPRRRELLKNLMLLVGNAAEVEELRPRLMKNEYLSVFSELLESSEIECRYNAARIISHMVSDGPEAWKTHKISVVKRQELLNRMVTAIEDWNVCPRHNVNYRSLKPTIRLLTVNHTPEIQLWAARTLASVTKVDPEKYCTLLRNEDGIKVMHHLTCSISAGYGRTIIAVIKELVTTALLDCMEYFEL